MKMKMDMGNKNGSEEKLLGECDPNTMGIGTKDTIQTTFMFNTQNLSSSQSQI